MTVRTSQRIARGTRRYAPEAEVPRLTELYSELVGGGIVRRYMQHLA